MHRIFASLPVSDDIADRLLPLRTPLAGANWRRREHFHVTLHFFGEVSPEIGDEIANGLDRVTASAFQLKVRGVGWFGRKAPHSLYARIEDHETLSDLAAQCEKLARRVGLTPEKRPFTPHITLAYLKDTPLPDVMHWSETYQTLRTQAFTCERFELMESLTGKYQQSRYVVQEDYPLTG